MSAGGSLFCLAQPPKITVVFVVDQLSAHYLEKTGPYLQGGIGSLMNQGVYYTNAFYDASPPSTAHGHTLLTTGTYGAMHGIIGNWWRTKDLKRVVCDNDTQERAAVFAPDGTTTLPFGRSAVNMQVDNLSDQLMMHSYPHARNTVWSLSMKSRAAILMAGHMGKAAWLNDAEGARGYTSSKAYVKKLPQWMIDFNKKMDFTTKKTVTWKPFYELCSKPYLFDDAGNYTAARHKPFINRTHDLTQKKGFEQIYAKSPQATIDFFKLATECVNATYKKDKNERFILWLNIASLDKVAHAFGCLSREALDTLYHIDDQIKHFMNFIYTKAPKEEVLFVLTGDHGGQPIPEVLTQRGYPLARRYVASELIEAMNKLVEEKHGIKKLVQYFLAPQFYLDMPQLKHLNEAQKQHVMNTLKDYLISLPGFRKSWTFDELEKTIFEPYDLDQLIKKELYQGRSGQLFYTTDPYTTIYKGKNGATHGTPYAYDTRVPLIFHQAGKFKPRQVAANRSMTQLSVTLANLLGVPRPSASVATVLPEIAP